MKKKINKRKIFLIAFGILVFIIITKLAKAPETKESLEQKLSKLNYNYQYSYTVKLKDETKITYSGKKMPDKDVGTKKVNGNSLKYYRDESFAYEVKNKQLYPIYDLYDNVNDHYFDTDYVKALISNQSFETGKNTYTFKVNNIEIVITTDRKDVKMIEITDNGDYYKLIYSNINGVTEVKY